MRKIIKNYNKKIYDTKFLLDITEEMKVLLGEVVKHAEIGAENEEEISAINKNLNDMKVFGEIDDEDIGLGYEYSTPIYITLNNGKSVKISSGGAVGIFKREEIIEEQNLSSKKIPTGRIAYSLTNPTHLMINSLEKNLLEKNNIELREGWDIYELPESIIMALYEYCIDGSLKGYENWQDTPIFYYFKEKSTT